MWYTRIKRLYEKGKIDKDGVMNAVNNGWITEEQAKEIIEGGH